MKKLLALLCMSALLFTIALPVGADAPEEPATRPADINDALAVLKHIAGIRTLYLAEQWLYNFNNSGFDGDGVLDIMDALIVLKGLAGICELPAMPKGYVPLEPLSKELELRIREDWSRLVIYEYKEGDEYDASQIYCHYGTYNGNVVVRIVGDCSPLTVMWELEVAGFKFRSGSPFPIRVWNDGEFRFLEEAFNESLLTEQDIEEIWNRGRRLFG